MRLLVGQKNPSTRYGATDPAVYSGIVYIVVHGINKAAVLLQLLHVAAPTRIVEPHISPSVLVRSDFVRTNQPNFTMIVTRVVLYNPNNNRRRSLFWFRHYHGPFVSSAPLSGLMVRSHTEPPKLRGTDNSDPAYPDTLFRRSHDIANILVGPFFDRRATF